MVYDNNNIQYMCDMPFYTLVRLFTNHTWETLFSCVIQMNYTLQFQILDKFLNFLLKKWKTSQFWA